MVIKIKKRLAGQACPASVSDWSKWCLVLHLKRFDDFIIAGLEKVFKIRGRDGVSSLHDFDVGMFCSFYVKFQWGEMPRRR